MQRLRLTILRLLSRGGLKFPVHRLTEDESTKLLNLESRIHERVIGQNEAVEAVSRAIRRGRADITTRKRPVSFIFAGPTGVRKNQNLLRRLRKLCLITKNRLSELICRNIWRNIRFQN